MAFVYSAIPMQLGYWDDLAQTVPVLLPMWVVTNSDLSIVENSIRGRRWGNIPNYQFFLRSYTNSTSSTTGEPTRYDFQIYNSGTNFPWNVPSQRILANNMLT